jgi:hypothetical protein
VSGVDEPALYAYEMAREYKQDPSVFLRKPIAELMRQVLMTHRLYERERQARGED